MSQGRRSYIAGRAQRHSFSLGSVASSPSRAVADPSVARLSAPTSYGDRVYPKNDWPEQLSVPLVLPALTLPLLAVVAAGAFAHLLTRRAAGLLPGPVLQRRRKQQRLIVATYSKALVHQPIVGESLAGVCPFLVQFAHLSPTHCPSVTDLVVTDLV